MHPPRPGRRLRCPVPQETIPAVLGQTLRPRPRSVATIASAEGPHSGATRPNERPVGCPAYLPPEPPGTPRVHRRSPSRAQPSRANRPPGVVPSSPHHAQQAWPAGARQDRPAGLPDVRPVVVDEPFHAAETTGGWMPPGLLDCASRTSGPRPCCPRAISGGRTADGGLLDRLRQRRHPSGRALGQRTSDQEKGRFVQRQAAGPP